MPISNTFEASSIDVNELFANGSTFFFIPAYQRQYSWGDDKLEKLFIDICHGYTLLHKVVNNVTFVGSIILVNDKSNKSVYPQNKKGLPPNVMTVIDGQQRLTSILILLSVLHERLAITYKRYPFKEDDTYDAFLKQEVTATIEQLGQTLVQKQTGGSAKNNQNWYPRMTRAYSDIWDRSTPKYDSPVAHHLYKYGKFVRQCNDILIEELSRNDDNKELWDLLAGQKQEEPFEPFYIEAKEMAGAENNDVVLNAIRKFRALLDDFCQLVLDHSAKGSAEIEVPTVRQISIMNYNSLLEPNEFPEDYDVRLRGKEGGISKTSDLDYKYFVLLTQLTLFSKYILRNVGVTAVTATSEDYAFDIFESLNTTGEPLTAIETFKAKVLQLENEEIQLSCRTRIEEVDNTLNQGSDKRKNTESLLITFALEEKGQKLAKHLNDQRFFLKIFDKFKNEEEKANFVDALYTAHLFVSKVWNPKVRKDPVNLTAGSMRFSGETHFCLDFLEAMSHTIVQALLIRYYSATLKDSSKFSDFEAIIKAAVAYSVLVP